jgi:hypothetical protein
MEVKEYPLQFFVYTVCCESDANMGFNPAQPVVNGAYAQIRFGHSKSPFDLKKIP